MILYCCVQYTRIHLPVTRTPPEIVSPPPMDQHIRIATDWRCEVHVPQHMEFQIQVGSLEADNFG